jgi:hypothetical protein
MLHVQKISLVSFGNRFDCEQLLCAGWSAPELPAGHTLLHQVSEAV